MFRLMTIVAGTGGRPVTREAVVLIVAAGVTTFVFCVAMGMWGRRKSRRKK